MNRRHLGCLRFPAMAGYHYTSGLSGTVHGVGQTLSPAHGPSASDSEPGDGRRRWAGTARRDRPICCAARPAVRAVITRDCPSVRARLSVCPRVIVRSERRRRPSARTFHFRCCCRVTVGVTGSRESESGIGEDSSDWMKVKLVAT